MNGNGCGEEVLNARTSSEHSSLPGSRSGMVVLCACGKVLLRGIIVSYSAGLFEVLLDF